jgi:hypothetical protein
MPTTKKNKNRNKNKCPAIMKFERGESSSINFFLSRMVFLSTFLLSMLMYLRTVSPSIGGGDSGELVAEGCTLGTSHPPGYPLYTIIVFLVTRVGRVVFPFNYSEAFMVNLTSCLFGALSSAYLSYSVFLLLRGKRHAEVHREESINAVAAIAMGLYNSYSPLSWQYSNIAEVFALHNMFVSIIIYTTVNFAFEPSIANFRRGAFVCGLALTNQHTSVLLSAPLIAWVLSTTQLYNPRTWIIVVQGKSTHLIRVAAGAFLSSFVMLYGTLPLFATMSPHPGSWGNVLSLRGFLHHFLRKDYGSFRLYSGEDTGAEGMYRRIFLWFVDFVFEQSNPLVGLCFIIGCTGVITGEVTRQLSKKQFSSKRSIARSSTLQNALHSSGMGVDMAILLSLAFYLIVFHFLANLPLSNELFFGIHQRFWLHPNLISFVIAGLGLASIMKKFVTHFPRQRTIILLLPCTSSCFAGLKGISVNNQSDNYHFRNYAASILTTLPEDAILFLNFDQTWTSVRYLQECEGFRTDVTSIHVGMMSFEWFETKQTLPLVFPGSHYTQINTIKWQEGGFTFSELLDANIDNFSGIFIGGKPSFPDPAYTRDYEELPHGIVSKITRNQVEILSSSPEDFRVESKDIWEQVFGEYATIGLPDKSKYGQVTWESTIVREFYDHFVSRAAHLLHLAVKQQESGKDKKHLVPSLAEACLWLELARSNDEYSAQSPSLWKNLGLCYLHLVKSKEQIFPAISDLLDPTILSVIDLDVWWDGSSDWKTWASNRWQATWGHYLGMEHAKAEKNYAAVKSLYDAVMKATNNNK